MALGTQSWEKLRRRLTDLLSADSQAQDRLAALLTALGDARMHMPFTVTEFTDFYASRHHATNVGTMFRGAENALPTNWLHIPIGYNGRASSVEASGTPVTRPHGQLKGPNDAVPHFGPSQRFDIELELGAIVGTPSDRPLSVAEAFHNIFGYVLLND
jgi:fumarylacetoacetase